MSKYFKFFFAIILLLGYTDIFAEDRYFTWVDPKTQFRTRINLETYELQTESNSKGWFNEGKIKLDPGIFNHFPAQIFNNYFSFDNGNRIRITVDGTGHVFDYFPFKKELIRIDDTFYSGYNFRSNKFVREGLVYSIGGVGFWNHSTIITYFDDKIKEWEILRSKNKGPNSILSGYQAYNSKLDVYYSGGSGINYYLEDDKTKILDEFFLFDFKKNKWELLGILNPKLPFKENIHIIWTGDFFLHFFDGNIFIINPQTNEVFLHKDSTKSLLFGIAQYVNKDTVINFWNKDRGVIQKISISEIRSKSTYLGEFYSPKTNVTWYYFGLALIICLGSFLWWKQKRYNKNKTFIFNDLERKLLLKLLELNTEEHLTTHDINDILETNNKSQDNQRKIRITFISELNNKLKLKFNIDNGIERKSLEEDKRLTFYILNQQIRTEIKNLLG
jgi:hypothetical protein